MPTVIVYTNAPRQVFPDDFLSDTVKLVCKILNKPFKGVAVILCNDVEMHVGEVINHVINLQAIGVGDFKDDTKNGQFVTAVIEYLTDITGIPTESIGISLMDVLPIQVGFAEGDLAYDKMQRRKRTEAGQEPKH